MGLWHGHPKIDELKNVILKALESKNGVNFTACCADGGLGKTTLAYIMLQDSEIKEAYPARIILQAGPECIGEKGAEDFLRRLVTQVMDVPETKVEQIIQKKLLSIWKDCEEPVLFVIDDVWCADALSRILKALPETVYPLITCRDEGILKNRAKAIRLDFLTENEGEALFLEKVNAEVGNSLNSADIHKLVRLVCGHPGCLVALAGQMNTLEDLPRIFDALAQRGLSEQESMHTNADSDHVPLVAKAVYEISWNSLNETEQQVLLKLSDLPAALPLNEDILSLLLELSEKELADALLRLSQLSLISKSVLEFEDLRSTFYQVTDWTRQLASNMGHITNLSAWSDSLIKWATYCYQSGWYTYALILYKKAWQILENLNIEDISLCMQIGNTYKELGRSDESFRIFSNLKPYFESLGSDNFEYAKFKMNNGQVYYNQGRYKEALELYLEAENGFAKLGLQSLEYSQLQMHRGLVYWRQGNYEAALKFYKEAEVGIEKLGINHIDYGNLMMNKALTYWEQGNYEKSLEFYQKAEPGFLSLGTEHPGYANLMMNKGLVYGAQALYEKALETFAKAEIGLQRLGSNHPDYANLMQNIGINYAQQGEFEKALNFHRRAEIGFQNGGGKHQDYANLMVNIGIASLNLGFIEQALNLFQEAECIYLELGSEHKNYFLCMMNIGVAYFYQGNFTDALRAFEKAKPGFFQFQIIPEHYIKAIMIRATENNTQEGYQEALNLFKETEALFHAIGLINSEYVCLLMFMGVAYGHLGQYQESIDISKKAESFYQNLHMIDDCYLQIVLNIAYGHKYQHNFSLEKAYYLKILPRIQKLFDQDPLKAQLLADIERLKDFEAAEIP